MGRGSRQRDEQRQSQRESEQGQKAAERGTTRPGRPGRLGPRLGRAGPAPPPAPRPAPSRSGGRRSCGPSAASRSHFPDTAGALAELCEECPRGAGGWHLSGPRRRCRRRRPACAREGPAPAARPAPARGARSPWQRDYGRRVLFILSRVPGNWAGRLPGAPPWGGGREREERVGPRVPGSGGRAAGEGSPWSVGVTDPSEGRLLRKH